MDQAEIFTLITIDNDTQLYDTWSETQGRPVIKTENNYRLISVANDERYLRYKVKFNLLII
jgi:hypothetical protein